MAQPNLIADELGNIRALIKTLRAREQVLRDRILNTRPNAPLEGNDWIVTVHSGTSRRINSTLLPDTIRNDPQYWKETHTNTVVSKRMLVREPDIMLVEAV